MTNLEDHYPSTVIVGAGLAGLYCALRMAPRPVVVISPTPLGEDASSAWAQGGIAAAVGLGDSAEAHAADTVAAGAGLVDTDIALAVARDAGECIEDLLRLGVPFDRDSTGTFLQSREAAHSRHRVVRVTGDRAGKAIMEALIVQVRRTESIRILEGLSAVGLQPGRTAETFDLLFTSDDTDGLLLRGARHVVLATGGVGALYRATTNPPTSTGSGLAIAARAGAEIADAEFVQFHPTAIAVDADPTPLASEALRGEGAWLVNGDGDRFMVGRHPDAELAPRDIVARAVFDEIAAGRGAYLDCREAIGSAFPQEFPTVYGMCRAHGIDPVRDLIPVAPAEHYHMGGVKTDAHGRSSISGLWAIGEAAATGLHGANRLASNSLLEAVVFARRVANAISDHAGAGGLSTFEEAFTNFPSTNPHNSAAHPQSAGCKNATSRAGELRDLLSRHVGVVRDADGLRAALEVLNAAAKSSDQHGPNAFSNRITAAQLITAAALRREESRGAHFRSDFPERSLSWEHRQVLTVHDLLPRKGPGPR